MTVPVVVSVTVMVKSLGAAVPPPVLTTIFCTVRVTATGVAAPASNAPMSGVASRRRKRWSVGAAPGPVPALIAGLPAGSANVFVGPPLLAIGEMTPEAWPVRLPLSEANPQLVPESMSWLNVLGALSGVWQLPEVLPLRIVLLIETVPPPMLSMAKWPLLAIVSSFKVALPSNTIASPAMEFVIVEFVTVAWPPDITSMALPLLPDRSEWSIDSVPPLPPAGGGPIATAAPFDGWIDAVRTTSDTATVTAGPATMMSFSPLSSVLGI